MSGSPCVGNMCFGFSMLIMSRISSLDECPETCKSLNSRAPASTSALSITALLASFISAGITLAENMTWSPEKFHGYVPLSILARVLFGSPWCPVTTSKYFCLPFFCISASFLFVCLE